MLSASNKKEDVSLLLELRNKHCTTCSEVVVLCSLCVDKTANIQAH